MTRRSTFEHKDTTGDFLRHYPKSTALGDPGLVEVTLEDGPSSSVWLPQLPALRLAKELIKDNLSEEESAMLLTILGNKITAIEDTPSAEDRQAIIDKYKFNYEFHHLSTPIRNLIDDTIRSTTK